MRAVVKGKKPTIRDWAAIVGLALGIMSLVSGLAKWWVAGRDSVSTYVRKHAAEVVHDSLDSHRQHDR